MEVSIPFPLKECGITTGGTCHKGKSAGRHRGASVFRHKFHFLISVSYGINVCVRLMGLISGRKNTRWADVVKIYLCRSCICLVCGADPDFMSPEICCIIIKESLHLTLWFLLLLFLFKHTLLFDWRLLATFSLSFFFLIQQIRHVYGQCASSAPRGIWWWSFYTRACADSRHTCWIFLCCRDPTTCCIVVSWSISNASTFRIIIRSHCLVLREKKYDWGCCIVQCRMLMIHSSIFIAIFGFHMPAQQAFQSIGNGIVFANWPIMWIVVNAM